MGRLFFTTEPDAKDYAKVVIKQFPDGDSYVRLPREVKGEDVLIYSRCYPNQNSRLMELLLMISACRDLGASSVRAFIPYLPYARQDKRILAGESISSETICSLLNSSGLDELITFDCHFLKRSGQFKYAGLDIQNLTAAPILLKLAKTGLRSTLVITPDQGAADLAKDEKGSQTMKKVRGEYDKGNTAYRKVDSLSADFYVEGRDVILIDDIVAGGSTMLKAVKLCKKGKARKIICATTHGQFLNHADKKIKRAGASKLVTTDSIKSIYSKVNSLDLARGSL